MPDYECYPLWIMDEKGLKNIDPDELDIPNELKIALHSWSDSYNNTLNLEDPSSSGFPDRELEKIFYMEGRRLFIELKKYLGNKYICSCFNVKGQN
ncbi:hypothetical protein [Pleurocapsa sp. PCC 7319]|uniref:hypothetical protein n=1 Tax=Pleurocapsa sp. PCC 7319 TaxID=118161 RepID=UPI0011818097|nr:hypothetical protein [Pleurocapsa sp. PCC 7319]